MGSHDSWWRDAVVYQVYPRSFADADGDGVGDLAGIASRVPYLAALGVDAVWLSPFYPSALADGGYDVDDHRDVHPQLGDLAAFDDLLARLHEVGIKVIVDIVPNHTSDRHPWFVEALAATPGSRARERYVFRRGRGDEAQEPPADWVSAFGGPAWEPVGDGDWYLHQFAPEQPDLDWHHPEVRADFVRTLRFWADRGVDGFRVDVADALTKDVPEHDLPAAADLERVPAGSGRHPLRDRDEVHDIYRAWRSVLDDYAPPRAAIAEAWVPAARRGAYAAPDGLGQAFNFDLLGADFDPAAFREIVTTNLEIAARAGSSSTWVLSNHDVIRHATRLALPAGHGAVPAGQAWLAGGERLGAADVERGLDRALAATLLTLALPGSTYLYQGEELGLPEVVDLAPSDRQDPAFVRSEGRMPGRDGSRIPLPWEEQALAFGFGGPPHLPQPSWFGQFAVDRQALDPASALSLYRRAIALRRRLRGGDGFGWLPTERDDVLAFERDGGWICTTNFGDRPYAGLVGGLGGDLLLSSRPLVDGALPGNATAWTRR